MYTLTLHDSVIRSVWHLQAQRSWFVCVTYNFMIQSLLEKLKEDMQRKENDLWKMTKKKEQYQGMAAAGDTTIKSLQVIVCVCHICHPCILCALAWTCVTCMSALALACIPTYCVCICVCVCVRACGHMCVHVCVCVCAYECCIKINCISNSICAIDWYEMPMSILL